MCSLVTCPCWSVERLSEFSSFQIVRLSSYKLNELVCQLRLVSFVLLLHIPTSDTLWFPSVPRSGPYHMGDGIRFIVPSLEPSQLVNVVDLVGFLACCLS